MPIFPVSPEKNSQLLELMERLKIKEDDLEESFIKGSGKGGQKINKTSSCVQLRHIPSGLEVRCQSGRSQAMNRFLARRLLCEKLESAILGAKSKRRQAQEKIRRQKRKRSKRAKEKILSDKLKRASQKKLRRTVSSDDG